MVGAEFSPALALAQVPGAPGRRRGSSPREKICVFCTFCVPVVGSPGTNRIQPGALKYA